MQGSEQRGVTVLRHCTEADCPERVSEGVMYNGQSWMVS